MSVLRLLEAAGASVAAVTTTTWNPADKNANVTLSNGNLAMTSSGLGGVRSVFSTTSGKWYFEITYTTLTTNSSNSALGVANVSNTMNGGVGSANAVTVGGVNGQYYIGATNTGVTFTSAATGRVYGIAIDVAASRIWVRNATNAPTSWNGSTSNNPATNTGGLSAAAIFGPSTAVYAWANAYSSDGVTFTANFGATAFTAAAPAGFNSGFG